jgi:hypothetical protein
MKVVYFIFYFTKHFKSSDNLLQSKSKINKTLQEGLSIYPMLNKIIVLWQQAKSYLQALC